MSFIIRHILVEIKLLWAVITRRISTPQIVIHIFLVNTQSAILPESKVGDIRYSHGVFVMRSAQPFTTDYT